MKPYTVTELTATVPVRDYVNSCVDVEKFLGYCRQCPNYGKRWACPPLAQPAMDIWNAYDSVRFYAWKLTPKPGLTLDGLMQGLQAEKIRLSRMVLELEPQFPGSRSMAAGTCVACSACTRPEGAPCRHPEQVRFSIEALGGDVSKTMETYLHTPLQWIRQGQMPEYLTLVAALLLKDPS